jgi:hypothetical protein
MTQLNYLADAPFECDPEDANVVAFIEAALIIGGQTLSKNFLPAVCGRLARNLASRWRRRRRPC